MANIGQIFKAAREKKKATLSQAAASTRLKIQHLEAMEKNDFSKIPAPAYAKGFIKLYSEYLGLDPAPLLKEYVELFSSKAPRAQKPLEEGREAKLAPPPKPIPLPDFKKMVGQLQQLFAKIPMPNIKIEITPKRIASAVGVLMLVLLVGKWINREPRPPKAPKEIIVEEKVVEPEKPKSPMTALLEEPPEPYIQIPSSTP